MNRFNCPTSGGPIIQYSDEGEKITSNCLTCVSCGACARGGFVPLVNFSMETVL